MPRPCVAIGGSAGSIEVLLELLAGLPGDLGAPVLVVVHLRSGAPSQLATVLGRASTLPVEVAVDGTAVHDGTVYVAPPDHHLILDDDHLRVHRGPRHQRHRPAIDPLLWSIGRSVDGGAVAVILSGGPGDGVAGAREIAVLGGTVLVQDPSEARFPDMPERVLAHVASARAVPTDRMAAAIVSALGGAPPSGDAPTASP